MKAILQVYARLERLITKTAGKKIFEFEEDYKPELPPPVQALLKKKTSFLGDASPLKS